MKAVTRMPSASVNLRCAAECGCSLRRKSRVPGGQVGQIGGLGDPRPVTDASRIDRWVPAVAEVQPVHGVLDTGVDRVTEGEPHPVLATGLGEGVGGPGRIRPHQLTRGNKPWQKATTIA